METDIWFILIETNGCSYYLKRISLRKKKMRSAFKIVIIMAFLLSTLKSINSARPSHNKEKRFFGAFAISSKKSSSGKWTYFLKFEFEDQRGNMHAFLD